MGGHKGVGRSQTPFKAVEERLELLLEERPALLVGGELRLDVAPELREVPARVDEPGHEVAGRRVIQEFPTELQVPLVVLTLAASKVYNRELDAYYAKMEVYAGHLSAWREQMDRSIGLDLSLANDGAAVAKDVDVSIALPSWSECASVQGEEVPWSAEIDPFLCPVAPAAPQRPKSLLEQMQAGIGNYPDLMSRFDLPAPPSNVGTWLDDEGVRVLSNITRLKHGHAVSLCTLWLRFPSRDVVKPFELPFVITTESHPDRITGRVLVKPALPEP